MITIWLVIGAETIIRLSYGYGGYGLSVLILQLCAPFVIVFLWNALLANALMAGNQQRRSAVVSAVKLGIGIVCYPLLTILFGVVGTAVATVLTGLVGTALNYLFLTRGMSLPGLLRPALLPLFTVGLVLFGVWMTEPWSWVLQILIATVVYIGVWGAIGAVSPSDWRLLRRLV